MSKHDLENLIRHVGKKLGLSEKHVQHALRRAEKEGMSADGCGWLAWRYQCSGVEVRG